MGVLVGQVRRRLSLAAVRAQAELLLDRIHQAEAGIGQATKRRQYAALKKLVSAF